MASVLHGSARTTPRIRAELKAAQAPARVLASQYGLSVKTVLKWRNRAVVAAAEHIDAAFAKTDSVIDECST